MESGTNRLYELRKEMGKSQTFVGDSVCISQSTMSLYENGAIIPSDALIRLAVFFNVSTDYLLGLSDERRGFSLTGISDEEYKLLKFYRKLPKQGKKYFNGAVDGIEKNLDDE